MTWSAAYAEIVLEGEVPPMCERRKALLRVPGLLLRWKRKEPIIQIKAITMRKDAIYKANQNGPDMEGCHYHRVPMSQPF